METVRRKPRGTYRGLVYRPPIETPAPAPVVRPRTHPTVQVDLAPRLVLDETQERRRQQRRRDEEMILDLLMQDKL